MSSSETANSIRCLESSLPFVVASPINLEDHLGQEGPNLEAEGISPDRVQVLINGACPTHLSAKRDNAIWIARGLSHEPEVRCWQPIGSVNDDVQEATLRHGSRGRAKLW
eukprot:CAMPEP_0179188282 /NCGR_PEP_ID=MMETSP0796-20121207/93444_1 /TAXON_ID=73915 /ORGANISM="Pyrodinium bahamense, Strain pbaha01" /LENGTH=109 /DNA_ID=CAMNT_0020892377 /DNA_START=344 /DNA_END=672 /DNA_ORIENTATION=+